MNKKDDIPVVGDRVIILKDLQPYDSRAMINCINKVGYVTHVNNTDNTVLVDIIDATLTGTKQTFMFELLFDQVRKFYFVVNQQVRFNDDYMSNSGAISYAGAVGTVTNIDFLSGGVRVKLSPSVGIYVSGDKLDPM